MRVREWVFFLIFAGIGALFYRGYFSRPVEVARIQQPRIANSSAFSAEILRNSVHTRPLPVSSPHSSLPHETLQINSRYLKIPRDLTVEFEMVGGLAVAFGDTVLGKPEDGFTGKSGLTEMKPAQLWDGGVVPYKIDRDVPAPERIKQAVDYFNDHTQVRFVPYDGQADWVIFTKGEQHCYSYLGKMGRGQPLYLSDHCGPTEIMHEMMHVLGFIHEQSRTDRDQSVEVLWENIEEQFYPQFAMVHPSLMDKYQDSPFDAHSIMMYDPRAFAVRPGVDTMKLKSAKAIEPSAVLSPSDIDRINRVYR